MHPYRTALLNSKFCLPVRISFFCVCVWVCVVCGCWEKTEGGIFYFGWEIEGDLEKRFTVNESGWIMVR